MDDSTKKKQNSKIISTFSKKPYIIVSKFYEFMNNFEKILVRPP